MFDENTIRNNMVLLEILNLYREDIEEKIESVRKEYDLPSNETLIPYHAPKEYSILLEKASIEMKNFIDRHNGFPLGFTERIDDIRKTTGLGREWNSTLQRFAVTGILFPPPFSVFVWEDKKNRTLTFETNKNTTRDDLLYAWDFYKKTRSEIFRKTKSHHYTKNDLAKISIIKELEELKEESEEKLTDEEVVSSMVPLEEIPFEKMAETDKKNRNWFKKNRERFRKEVTN